MDAAKSNGCADYLRIICCLFFVFLKKWLAHFVIAKALWQISKTSLWWLHIELAMKPFTWTAHRTNERNKHKSFRYLNWCMFEIKNSKSQSACIRAPNYALNAAQFIWVFEWWPMLFSPNQMVFAHKYEFEWANETAVRWLSKWIGFNCNINRKML